MLRLHSTTRREQCSLRYCQFRFRTHLGSFAAARRNKILPLQAKMAFPFWNWVSSRKSSWTYPLPTLESRHTRPVSTSPTRDRSASSAESRRPINCSATRLTPPWSRARWATLSNTGKWTLLESLPKKPKNLKVCCPTVRQIRQTAVQSQQRRGFRSPSGFPHLYKHDVSRTRTRRQHSRLRQRGQTSRNLNQTVWQLQLNKVLAARKETPNNHDHNFFVAG